MADATKQPSGLSITRNNLKFFFDWKIADADYGLGQELQWRMYNGKWTNWEKINIAADVTSAAKSLNAKDFFPNKNTFLYAVVFRVRGKRADYQDKNGKTHKCDWSKWSEKKWEIYGPRMGSVSESLDSEAENRTTFTWNFDVSDTDDDNPFYNTEWQSILVKECKQTDGAKLTWKKGVLGWQTGSGNRNSSKTFTEETELISNASYTRWFRIRSRGAGGNGWTQSAKNTGCSYWRYSKHVYAWPYVTKINKAVKEGSANWIRVNWKIDTNAAHPVDLTTVEYAIDVPKSGLGIPDSPSWQLVNTFTDTGGNDETSFLINERIPIDNLVWVRVTPKHDRRERPTTARVMNGKLPFNGGMAPPEFTVTVSPLATVNRATITITDRGSTIPDAKTAVILRRTGKKDVTVGVLLNNETSKEVDCPKWDTGETVAFVLYNYQGTQTSDTIDGYRKYQITANMKSAEVSDGGAVPIAPTNVKVTNGNTLGEAKVTWSWAWSTASFTEISWSTNEYAWESTDQPSTYEINNLNAARWRINGLEPGVKYYFRLRFGKRGGDEVIYGPYCDAVEFTPSLDASELFTVTSLSLSEAVIPITKSFIASWNYESSDGSLQTGAEIREVFFDEYPYEADAISDRAYAINDIFVYNGTIHKAKAAITIGATLNDETGGNCEITDVGGTRLKNVQVTDKNVLTFGATSISSQKTLQSVTLKINASKKQWTGWTIGTQHYLAVRVKTSTIVYGNDAWSSPIPIAIANPVTCTVSDISLEELTIGEDETEKTVLSLTSLPLTLTVDEANENSTISVLAERTADYRINRPDESVFNGYEGESIIAYSQKGVKNTIYELTEDEELDENKTYYTRTGSGTDADPYVYTAVETPDVEYISTYYEFTVDIYGDVSIGFDDLVGSLDDGAKYKLTVTLADEFGQTDSKEYFFEVHWNHQAFMPGGEVEVLPSLGVALLGPISDADDELDVCDIYRLSIDKPELIYENAQFGEIYVDPYPSIGEFGGYRFVYKTVYGDYITADNVIAWYDASADFNTPYTIIDFGEDRVNLLYNVDLSNSWSKDFRETTYLGGSIQGDWNPAVSRTASVSAVSVIAMDQNTIAAMRRLAVYSGICHIRTKDGSSFDANIDVSESRGHEPSDLTVQFSLDITRVDPEVVAGMTYADWIATQDEPPDVTNPYFIID